MKAHFSWCLLIFLKNQKIFLYKGALKDHIIHVFAFFTRSYCSKALSNLTFDTGNYQVPADSWNNFQCLTIPFIKALLVWKQCSLSCYYRPCQKTLSFCYNPPLNTIVRLYKEGCNKVFTQVSLLQAEQSQLLQPVSIGGELQPSGHFHWSSPDPTPSVLGTPEPNRLL